jgi:hypothetical protein
MADGVARKTASRAARSHAGHQWLMFGGHRDEFVGFVV